MKFVDQVSINIESGAGGSGAIGFRREKYIPKGGPDGGDGGRGGHVIFRATRTLQTLMDLKLRQLFKAPPGDGGGKKNKSGLFGKDLIVRVPCGTMVFDKDHTLIADLTTDGEEFIIAEGGKGGRGNQHFATPTNRTPRHFQPGISGESKKVTLELRLIAEVGLVGFPNAGKSTLLKSLTSANPKIGDYPFTTLYPNLGVLKFVDREIVLADIPGLIEGASKGQGLGHDFLRHISRTKLMLHLVAIDPEHPDDLIKQYHTILNELAQSKNKINTSNPMITVLSKTDLVDTDTLDSIITEFKSNGIDVIPLSSHTRQGIPDLIKAIEKGLR
ncbi:GTPase ObgE [bacterium]|nr:GTPase ObgE [bacterium]